jgi:hypothetical protein
MDDAPGVAQKRVIICSDSAKAQGLNRLAHRDSG